MKTMKRLLALLLALSMVMPNCLTIASAYTEEFVEELVEEVFEEEFIEEELIEEELSEEFVEEVYEEVIEEEILDEEVYLEYEVSDDVSNGEAELVTVSMEPYCIPDAEDDSEKQFAAFANSILYPDRPAMLGTSGKDALSGAALEMYEALEGPLQEVARGDLTSTEIPIHVTALPSDPEFGMVIDALLADMPFYLYWYDKVRGCGYGGGGYEGSYDLVVRFKVTSAYSATGATGTYETSGSKTAAAVNAAEYARQIAQDYACSSDYETMQAYADWIMGEVAYNYDAASGSNNYFSAINSNPWQLIYVFDQNPETNVVCEGYSKAFQYLCDLAYANGNMDSICYSVTGDLYQNGSNLGGHMWNLVQIDDARYLADVTNCDSGWALFLVGAQGEEVTREERYIDGETGEEYSVTGPTMRYSTASGLGFEYDLETVDLYTMDDLLLADSDYEYIPGEDTGSGDDGGEDWGDPENPNPEDPNPDEPEYTAYDQYSLQDALNMYMGSEVELRNEVNINGEFEIPEGTTLRVIGDGWLRIEDGAAVFVNGSLLIDGTYVDNYGNILLSGEMANLALENGGQLNNYRNIEVQTQGATLSVENGSYDDSTGMETETGFQMPVVNVRYFDDESLSRVSGLDQSQQKLYYNGDDASMLRTLAQYCGKGASAMVKGNYAGYHVNVDGTMTISEYIDLHNIGSLAFAPGGELVLANGSMLYNMGSINVRSDATVTIDEKGNLDGYGSFIADGTVNNNGTISWGAHPNGEVMEMAFNGIFNNNGALYVNADMNSGVWYDITNVDRSDVTLNVNIGANFSDEDALALLKYAKDSEYGMTRICLYGERTFSEHLALVTPVELHICGTLNQNAPITLDVGNASLIVDEGGVLNMGGTLTVLGGNSVTVNGELTNRMGFQAFPGSVVTLGETAKVTNTAQMKLDGSTSIQGQLTNYAVIDITDDSAVLHTSGSGKLINNSNVQVSAEKAQLFFHSGGYVQGEMPWGEGDEAEVLPGTLGLMFFEDNTYASVTNVSPDYIWLWYNGADLEMFRGMETEVQQKEYAGFTWNLIDDLTIDGDLIIPFDSWFSVSYGNTLTMNGNLTVAGTLQTYAAPENGSESAIVISEGYKLINSGEIYNYGSITVPHPESVTGWGQKWGNSYIYVSEEVPEDPDEPDVPASDAQQRLQNQLNNGGYVYLEEDVTVTGTLTIPNGSVLVIDPEVELTVSEGAELINNGQMVFEQGILVVDGTLTNNRVIAIDRGCSDSQITVNGTFINNNIVRLHHGDLTVTGTYVTGEYGSTEISVNTGVTGVTTDDLGECELLAFASDENQLREMLEVLQSSDASGFDTYSIRTISGICLEENLTIPEGIQLMVGYGNTDCMTIPEDVTVTIEGSLVVQHGYLEIEEGGTLIIGANAMVTNNNEVNNYGTIINNGSDNWYGVVPEGNPIQGGGYTVESLQAALDAAAEGDVITLSNDLEISAAGIGLTVPANVTLEIASGTTLTIATGIVVKNLGVFTLAEGATLINNGSLNHSGIAMNINGEYSDSTGEFIVGTDEAFVPGTINGLESSELTVSASMSAEAVPEYLTRLMNYAPSHKGITIVLNGNPVIEGELYIPANVRFMIMNGTTLTVAENAVVDNYGTITIRNGVMHVDGTLNNYGTVTNVGTVNYSGIINKVDGSTWTGSEPIRIQNKSPEQIALEEALAAGGLVYLDQDLTIADTLEIPSNAALTIRNNCTLTVPEGAELVVNGNIGFESGKLDVAGLLNINGSVELSWHAACELNVSGKLQNNGRLRLYGGTTTVTGTYEGTGVLAAGIHASVSGLAPKELHAMAITEEDLREALEVMGSAENYALRSVKINADITLSENLTIPEGVAVQVGFAMHPDPYGLTIPENVTLTVMGDLDVRSFVTVTIEEGGSLVINEGGSVYNSGTILSRGSFLNNGHVNNQGTVQIPADGTPAGTGTWEGNVPTTEEIPVPPVEEEEYTVESLQAAMNAASEGTVITLNNDLTIEGMFFEIPEGVTLEIASGVTLVISETLRNNGTFVALEGSVIWNNAILENGPYGNMEIRGDYNHNYDQHAELKIYTRPEPDGLQINDIEGVENHFKAIVTETDDLACLFAGLDFRHEFGQAQVHLSGDHTIEDGLYIPGNGDLHIYGNLTVNGDITLEGGQIHVEAGGSLTSNGAAWIMQGAYVNVHNSEEEDVDNGVWNANAPIHIGFATEPDPEGNWATGVLDVCGELNANDYVNICEGAHLNVYGTMTQDDVIIENHGLFNIEGGTLNENHEVYNYGEMRLDGALNINTGNVWNENGGSMTISENSRLSFAEGSSICVWDGGSLENHADLSDLETCVNITPWTASWSGVPDENIYATYFVNNEEELERALTETYDAQNSRVRYGFVEYMPYSSFRINYEHGIPNGSILQLWDHGKGINVTVSNGAKLIVDDEAGIIINPDTRLNIEQGGILEINGWVNVTDNGNDGNKTPGILWYYEDASIPENWPNTDEGGWLIKGTMSQEELEAALADAEGGWVHEAFTQVENELVINKDFYLDDYGTIVVPSGTTLVIDAYFKLIGGNINVHQGGKLVLKNHMDIFDGTVFVDNNGDNPGEVIYEGGDVYGEITFANYGTDDEGNEIIGTMPYISANWVHNNGSGWFVNNNDHPELRGLSMPNTEWRFIFFLNTFSYENTAWERTPLAIEELIPGENVVLTPMSEDEWEQPAPGQEDLFPYFVKVRFDDPGLWDADTRIEYEYIGEDYGAMLNFNIRVERNVEHGFYTAPEASNETWMDHFMVNPLEPATEFYYVYTDPNCEIISAELEQENDLVESFERVEGTNAWKITLNQDVIRTVWQNHENFNDNIRVKAIVTDGNYHENGDLNTWETYNDIWGQIWWPHEHEADLSMDMDAGDGLFNYRYYEGSGWVRYANNGAEIVDMAALGFSYESNTLTLNGADVDGLHFYGGEGRRLNLELVGENYINTMVDFGTSLLVAENMQLTIGGSGTLTIGGNGQVSIDVHPNSKLNLAGGTINVSHGDMMLGGMVTISGAEVNMAGGQVNVDNRLDLTGGELNITALGHEDWHNERPGVRHTHYDGINVGWGKLLRIAGGDLNITIPEASTESAWFRGINVNAGNLILNDGTITIDSPENIYGDGIHLDCAHNEMGEPIEGTKSTFVMNGGKLVMKESLFHDGEGYGTANVLWGDGNAEVTINGGEMDLDAVNIELNGKTTWNGGVVNGEEQIILAGGPEFVINGGTFNLTGAFIPGDEEIFSNALFRAHGEVKMNGGTMNITNGILAVITSFELNGGEININNTEEDFQGLRVVNYMAVKGGTLNVTVPGGEWTNPETNETVVFPAVWVDGTLHQMGGTVNFTSDTTAAIRSEGSVLLNNGTMNLKGLYGIGQLYNENNPDGMFFVSGGKLNIEATDTGIFASNSSVRFVPGKDEAGNVISDPTVIIEAEQAAIQMLSDTLYDELYINEYTFVNADGETLVMDIYDGTQEDKYLCYVHNLLDGDSKATNAKLSYTFDITSQEELDAMLNGAEDDYFVTSRDIRIAGDVTLSRRLIMNGLCTLTIAEGAVLTIPEGGQLSAMKDATILVEDGAKIVNYGILAANMGDIYVTNPEGGYEHHDGAEVIWHHDYGVHGTITNIPAGYWSVRSIAGNVEQINAINEMADSGDYADVTIEIFDPITLTGPVLENPYEIRVSRNAPWYVYNDISLDPGIQLTIEKGAQLNLWGVNLQANGILQNNGTLDLTRGEVRGSVTVGDSGILSNSGEIRADGALISVQGRMINSKPLHLNDGPILAVDGTLINYSEIHVAYPNDNDVEDGGHLYINGTFYNYGCLTNYGAGNINIRGTLNVEEMEMGTTIKTGFIENHGNLNVNEGGALNIGAAGMTHYGTLLVEGMMNINANVENYGFIGLQTTDFGGGSVQVNHGGGLKVINGGIVHVNDGALLRNGHVFEDGGWLENTNGDVRIRMGTVYVADGGDIRGPWDGTITRQSGEGDESTDPYISANWLNNEDGWYEEWENGESRGMRMLPGEERWVIFYVNQWNAEELCWMRNPLQAVGGFGNVNLLPVSSLEDQVFQNPDNPNNFYFTRVKAQEDAWNTVATVDCPGYADYEIIIGRDLDHGYYSAPEATNENWVEAIEVNNLADPIEDKVVYYMVTASGETMNGNFEIFTDAEDDYGIYGEYIGNNTIKITIPADTIRNMTDWIWIETQAEVENADGHISHRQYGTDIRPVDMGQIEHNAWMRVNGMDVNYSAAMDQWFTHGEHGPEVVNMAELGLFYDYDSNTLTMDGANLSDLEVGYYGWDENGRNDEHGTDLPKQELTIKLVGENSIVSYTDSALRVYRGVKLEITGNGRLNLAAHHGDEGFHNEDYTEFWDGSAIGIGNEESSLTISGNAEVTAEVSGRAYYMEDGVKMDGNIRTIGGHYDSSILTVKDNAKLTTIVPEGAVHNNGTVPAGGYTGGYRGIADFVEINVQDNAVLITQDLDIGTGYYNQTGGQVTINALGFIDFHQDREGVVHTHFNGIRAEGDEDGGYITITGGELNINIPAPTTESAGYSGIGMDGGILNITGNAEVTIDGNSQGTGIELGHAAMTLDEDAVLNFNEEPFTWITEEGRPAFNRPCAIWSDGDSHVNMAGGTINAKAVVFEFNGTSPTEDDPEIETNGKTEWNGTELIGEMVYFGAGGNAFTMNGGRIELTGEQYSETHFINSVFDAYGMVAINGGDIVLNDGVMGVGAGTGLNGGSITISNAHDQMEGLYVQNYFAINGGELNISVPGCTFTNQDGQIESVPAAWIEGTFHQMGGNVNIMSESTEAIKNFGSVELNGGTMALNGKTAMLSLAGENGWVFVNQAKKDVPTTLRMFGREHGLVAASPVEILGGNVYATTYAAPNAENGIYPAAIVLDALYNEDGTLAMTPKRNEQGQIIGYYDDPLVHLVVAGNAKLQASSSVGKSEDEAFSMGILAINAPVIIHEGEDGSHPEVVLRGDKVLRTRTTTIGDTGLRSDYDFVSMDGYMLLMLQEYDAETNEYINTLMNGENAATDARAAYKLTQEDLVDALVETKANGTEYVLNENFMLTDDLNIDTWFTIPYNVTLTIPEGKTLTVTAEKFVNHGTIDVEGTLVISGYIYNDGHVDVDGTLNGSGSVFNGTTTMVNEGGVIDFNGKWEGYAPINNGGTIIGSAAYLTQEKLAIEMNIADKMGYPFALSVPFTMSGDLEVVGTLIINNTFTVPAGMTLTIPADAKLIVKGELIAKGTVKNEGLLNIHDTVTVTGTLVNNGGIFMADDNASFIAEGGTVTNNAMISTEATTATIDFTGGTYKHGSLTVDNVKYPAELDVDYFADGTTANVKLNDMSKATLRYIGEDYAAAAAMMAKAKADGYHNYILAVEGDMQINEGYDNILRIEKGSYLTVKPGSSMTLYGYLINQGTVYLGATDDEAANLVNYGWIVNEGTFQAAPGSMLNNSSTMENGVGGTMNLNGIYEHNGRMLVTMDNQGNTGALTGNIAEYQKTLWASISDSVNDRESFLRMLIDNAYAYSNAEIYLLSDVTVTKELMIPDGVSLFIGSEDASQSGSLTLAKDVQLTNEGLLRIHSGNLSINGRYIAAGTLEVHNGTVTVNGSLVNGNYMNFWSNATLINNGIIDNGNLNLNFAEGATYIHGENAELMTAYIDFGGFVSENKIDGIAAGYQTLFHPVRANFAVHNEDTIREMMAAVQAGGYAGGAVWIFDKYITIENDLTIPENVIVRVGMNNAPVELTIAAGAKLTIDGTMTVEEGNHTVFNKGIVTVNGDLINNGNFVNENQLDVYGYAENNGCFYNELTTHVYTGATLNSMGLWDGYAPYNMGGTITGESFRLTQAKLEAAMAAAAADGIGFALTENFTLERDLNVNCNFTVAEGVELTVPANVKMTVLSGNQLTVNGKLINNGTLVIENNAVLDPESEGTIENNGSAVVQATTVDVTNDPATGKPELSWKAVPGAVEYIVRRGTTKTSSGTVITTTDETSYIDESAVVGKTYYYHVIAVFHSDIRSGKSNVDSCICDLAQPVIELTNVDSTGKIKVSWKAVSDAVEYKVYRATSQNGSYTLKKTTTSTSWTDTEATVGTTYYYKVMAVASNTSANSADSKIESLICKLARPDVTPSIVASSGKPKLTWKAITGATFYEVWRNTSESGEYTKVATTDDITWTDSKAEAGTKYYYRVKALAKNEDANSALSSVDAAFCDLAQPEIELTNVDSTGKIKVSWKAISGAVKYEVYRATSKTGNYSVKKTTTSTSWTDDDATAGKTYYYKVKAIAKNSSANSVYSSIESCMCDLARPAITLSNVDSTGKVKVSWKAITNAEEYKVYRATSETGEYSLQKTTTSTSWTDTGATAGRTYYYKVRAIAKNTSANSVYSNVESCACNLAQPTVTLSNLESSGKIKVSWKSISNAVEYEVWRATSQNGTYTCEQTTASTSWTDTSAVAGKTYYYKVIAVAKNNSANSAYSAIKSCVCDLARPAITLSNVDSTGKIKVSWKAISDAEEYKVYRATSKTGTYSLKKTTASTSWTDADATAGKTYYYKVKAIAKNSSANSAYSTIKSCMCDLAQPTVTLSNVSSTGKIKVSWKAVTGAVKYEVLRATSQNGTYARKVTTTSTSWTDTSAAAGTTYYYKVKAIAKNTSANSVDSVIKSRLCNPGQPTVTMSNVAATGKIKVSWSAVTKAVRYDIYRSESKSSGFEVVKSTTSTSWIDDTALTGKTYYYKVKAIAANDAESVFSVVKSGTYKLAQPSVSITRNTKGKPKLTWKAVDGAVSYKVYRATSKTGTYSLLTTTKNTSYTNTAATAGKTYYYKVMAIAANTSANSAYSAIKQIKVNQQSNPDWSGESAED